MGFDVHGLVAALVAARAEPTPEVAVQEVLTRAFARPGEVADALGRRVRLGSILLHRSDDFTVQHFVMPPAWRTGVHDHRMWAVIAIFGGQEDNAFFRRSGSGISESGGRRCRPGDVLVLGDDVVHEVASGSSPTGAIHVYGGDLHGARRSQWAGEPPQEQPYDTAESAKRYLAAMTAADLLVR
jgi:predicted metal-dependent enzyme (double-stranded beta helix superfamily)